STPWTRRDEGLNESAEECGRAPHGCSEARHQQRELASGRRAVPSAELGDGSNCQSGNAVDHWCLSRNGTELSDRRNDGEESHSQNGKLQPSEIRSHVARQSFDRGARSRKGPYAN